MGIGALKIACWYMLASLAALRAAPPSRVRQQEFQQVAEMEWFNEVGIPHGRTHAIEPLS